MPNSPITNNTTALNNTPKVDNLDKVPFTQQSQIAYPAQAKELVEPQTTNFTNELPNLKAKPTTDTNTEIDNVIVTPIDFMDDRSQLATNRIQQIYYSVLVGGIYAVIGFLIDCLFNLIKSFNTLEPATVIWFFLPTLTVLGLVTGWLFGTRALDILFAMFRTTPAENNPTTSDDSFLTGIMKAIGFGILIAIIGWFLMLIIS